MRYRYDATIPWPRHQVTQTMRDDIQRIALYIDGVASVTRLESPPDVNRHRWMLSATAFPAGLASWLPPQALGFEDSLTWRDHSATFAVTPLVHADAVAFAGTLHLHEDGYDTLLEVDGSFELTPYAVAKLPDVLRGRGVQAIEAAVVASVRNHLGLACRAVDALLTDAI